MIKKAVLSWFILNLLLACTHTKQAPVHIISDVEVRVPSELSPKISGSQMTGTDSFLIIFRQTPIATLSEAEKYTESRIHEVRRLMERQVDFYYGNVTDNSQCIRDISASNELLGGIEYPANENYAIVACDSAITFSGRTVFLYCPAQKKLHEIKSYSRKGTATPQIDFRCVAS
jgi:hypothetical protein